MKIDRIDNLPFGRAYKVYNETEFHYLPSVTTILKRNHQQWLVDLKDKLGERKFDEVTERGGRRGSVMHIFLEIFIDEYQKTRDPEHCLIFAQKEISLHPNLIGWNKKYPKEWKSGRDLFYNFYSDKFWESIKEVLHSEVFLYTFFKGGWAGATDFVYLNWDDEIIMEDFKSSSNVKDEEKIVNYFMQISCYMFMYAERFNKLPKRGIIKITNVETNSMQVFKVEDYEFKPYLKEFLVLLEDFYKTEEWRIFINSTKQLA